MNYSSVFFQLTEKPEDCEEAKPEVPKAVEKIEAGTSDFLVAVEQKRPIKVGTCRILVIQISTGCSNLVKNSLNSEPSAKSHKMKI
jgi:hypothetical protein